MRPTAGTGRAWSVAAALFVLAGIVAPRGVAGQGTPSPHGDLTGVTGCVACHTAEGWVPAKNPMDFDHDRSTSFALTGRHADAACTTCHIGLRFDEPRAAAAECTSCHIDVHRNALGSDCASCHDTESFVTAPTADAHLRTSFPLTGAHLQLTCETCHVDDRGGQFAPLDTDCLACHESDYRGAQFVDHVANGYPTDCLECHSTGAWRQAPVFDHATQANGFELLGAHARTTCEGCHLRPGNDLRFAATDQSDCIACHQSDYDRRHSGSGIPTTCAQCHNVDDWDDAVFDHDETGFPLIGRHTGLDCESCHRQPGNELVFPAPQNPQDCVACHRADYDREHQGSGFPTDCLQCHTADSWDEADFDHDLTGFALVGVHRQASCGSCHREPGHELLFPAPTAQDDCIACHRAEYDAEHGGSSTSTTCTSCHSPDDWDNVANFNHASTGFALIETHGTLTCDACHNATTNALIFAKPSGQTDCIACHQSDYQAEHAGSGYSTACLDCHDQTRFQGATFDHDAFNFSLVGAHTSLGCDQCHNPVDNALLFPVPTFQDDCIACHQTDFQIEHAGTGYPTTCLTCHTTTTFQGATFDHDADFFPIYSGKHQGEWSSCATCHTVPNDYASFTCLTCHEHNQKDMDDKHKNESGYAYQSQLCYNCHPDGRH